MPYLCQKLVKKIFKGSLFASCALSALSAPLGFHTSSLADSYENDKDREFQNIYSMTPENEKPKEKKTQQPSAEEKNSPQHKDENQNTKHGFFLSLGDWNKDTSNATNDTGAKNKKPAATENASQENRVNKEKNVEDALEAFYENEDESTMRPQVQAHKNTRKNIAPRLRKERPTSSYDAKNFERTYEANNERALNTRNDEEIKPVKTNIFKELIPHLRSPKNYFAIEGHATLGLFKGAVSKPSHLSHYDIVPKMQYGGGLALSVFVTEHFSFRVADEVSQQRALFNDSAQSIKGDQGENEKLIINNLTFNLHYDALPQRLIDPYVGVGWVVSSIIGDLNPKPQHTLKFHTEVGFNVNFGANINVSDNTFLSLDLRHVWNSFSMQIQGDVNPQNIAMNPWILSVGFGYRF